MKFQFRNWKTWLLSCVLALVATFSVLFAYFPQVLLGILADRELRAQGMKTGELLIDGHEIHYAEGGKADKPTLLLVHGFRSSMGYWLPYLSALTQEYHVVLLDLPAHGRSDRFPGFKYDLVSMGDWLAHFMQVKGIETADVMGASMGGGISLAMAARHPELVQRVSVINPLAVTPPHESEVHAALATGKNLLLPSDYASFFKMQEVVYGSRLDLNPILAKLILNSLVRDRPFFLMAFDQMVKSGGLEKLLPDIKAPVLVIQSHDDQVVDPSSIEIMQQLVPRMEVVWITKGAHTLIGANRERAIEVSMNFFDRSQTLAREK